MIPPYAIVKSSLAGRSAYLRRSADSSSLRTPLCGGPGGALLPEGLEPSGPMKALFECLEDLTGSRSGQGLVEYGLIMVMAVILIVFAMSTLGADISEPMNNVANAF